MRGSQFRKGINLCIVSAAAAVRLSEIDAAPPFRPPVVNFRPDFALKVKSWLIALMFPIFANFWMGAISLSSKMTVPTITMDESRYYWKPQNLLKILFSIIITFIVMNNMLMTMMVIMIVLCLSEMEFARAGI